MGLEQIRIVFMDGRHGQAKLDRGTQIPTVADEKIVKKVKNNRGFRWSAYGGWDYKISFTQILGGIWQRGWKNAEKSRKNLQICAQIYMAEPKMIANGEVIETKYSTELAWPF